MGTTIEERLRKLLDQSDQTIQKLKGEIESLQDRIRGLQLGWTEHETLPPDQALPVPRLEMVARNTEYGYECLQRLVYRHFLGDVIAVPLGHTAQSGSPQLQPGQPIQSIHMPYRDGMHMYSNMLRLGLPGFLVYGDQAENLTERRAMHLGPVHARMPWPKWNGRVA